MKLLKWIAVTLVSLVVILAVGIGVFFDPNAFKPQIIDKVGEATGRTLTIDDEIDWSLYPKVGLQLGGVSLGNLPGQDLPPMLAVEQVNVGVNLLPLLSRDLQIEQVSLSGVTLNLVTLEDGRSSLDGLGSEASTQTDASSDTGTQTASAPVKWSLGKLQLSNFRFISDDRQLKIKRELEIESLSLDNFEPERAAPFKVLIRLQDPQLSLETDASAMLTVAADFSQVQLDAWKQKLALSGSALPNGTPIDLNIGFDANLNLAKQQYGLSNLAFDLGEFSLKGAGSIDMAKVRPMLTVELDGNHLVLDPYMPQATTSDGAPAPTTPKSEPESGPQGEPDLSVLRQFDLAAKMSLDSITAKQWRVDNPDLELHLNDGVFKISKMKAQAFEGTLMASAKLDSTQNPVTYDFDTQIRSLQISPLLKAAIDSEVLAGAGDFSIKGAGASLEPQAILSNLIANGELSLNDGAVYGINVAHEIRKVQAQLKGETLEQDVDQKTDFAAFDTKFSFDKGVVTTPSIELSSPLLRLSGKGSSNVVEQSLDYEMTVSVVGSLEGQGGKSLDELKGLSIPLTIEGGYTDPKVGVDLDALLNNKLKQEGEKLKDKLKDKLFKGFGRD
ncbi:AsmA family protein [Ferrimonas aestuarii]|uniref:AsmA family protein n=1 Tax=Ferrimonas aestuarii TaxID=2569539 RepID=A0A4U1BMF2_9GAMM|nr:AsmA family protein [Ferrimonas aestuarii]TKB54321.1 AsmA family protein [Ferrimonas aestuarii]